MYVRSWPNNKKIVTFPSWQCGKNKIRVQEGRERYQKPLYHDIYQTSRWLQDTLETITYFSSIIFGMNAFHKEDSISFRGLCMLQLHEGQIMKDKQPLNLLYAYHKIKIIYEIKNILSYEGFHSSLLLFQLCDPFLCFIFFPKTPICV